MTQKGMLGLFDVLAIEHKEHRIVLPHIEAGSHIPSQGRQLNQGLPCVDEEEEEKEGNQTKGTLVTVAPRTNHGRFGWACL